MMVVDVAFISLHQRTITSRTTTPNTTTRPHLLIRIRHGTAACIRRHRINRPIGKKHQATILAGLLNGSTRQTGPFCIGAFR
ncbi:hypothetical protein C7964_11011 [Loktanella sp. PT4BL]|nr:hypothetical protein C7964_11011 [Loktanella sp. PT4BL]